MVVVRCVMLLCLLLLVAPVASGQADPQSALMAAEVAQRWDDGDEAGAVKLGRSTRSDPWMVSFRLVAEGRPEIARALSENASIPELAGLAEQVASWSRSALDPTLLAQWDELELAYDLKDWNAVLLQAASLRSRKIGRVPFLRDAELLCRGLALDATGEHAGALEVLRNAAKRTEALGWFTAAARALWTLGHAERRVEQYEQALGTWSQCAALYDRLGRTTPAAMTRANLGALCHQLGDHRYAVRVLSESVKILDAGI